MVFGKTCDRLLFLDYPLAPPVLAVTMNRVDCSLVPFLSFSPNNLAACECPSDWDGPICDIPVIDDTSMTFNNTSMGFNETNATDFDFLLTDDAFQPAVGFDDDGVLIGNETDIGEDRDEGDVATTSLRGDTR